jgi:L-fuconolactonase
MLKIDSHQHFWKFDPIRDSWIDESMSVIQKDFFPEDLEPILKANGIDGCVVVQSDQSETENHFQIANVDKYDFVKGIVGWVNLSASNIQERLEYFSQFKKLKGFRHVLQGEPQRDFMLRPEFLNGISLLDQYNFTYDILVFPDQLKFVKQFVEKFPNHRFVIDHIAKPYIKDNIIEGWQEDMKAIAEHKNVYCKISGMVTEANWNSWKKADFYPYMDVVVNAFGTDRVMFGSDWPVCLVAAKYSEVLDIVKDYFSGYSDLEHDKVFGGNAIEFYSL